MQEVQDLDDSTIEEVLKVLEECDRNQDRKLQKVISNSKTDKPKADNLLRIFDESMNISNLNVSFNSANAKHSDDRKERKAQLVKSFGKSAEKQPEPPPAPVDPEDDFNNTPRSSMLYQAEDSDNYENDKFEDEESDAPEEVEEESIVEQDD